MGYALFANRKIFYTNLVYSLQTRLDNIMQQKQNLLNFSANISDGVVTGEEMASDLANLNNYLEFDNDFYDNYLPRTSDCDAYYEERMTEEGYDEQSKENMFARLRLSYQEDHAKEYNKKLEAMENQLDMQQQKIQSQLSVAQQQLQATEEAEGKAIESATPKYNGVG